MARAKRYTPAQLDWLRANYQRMTVSDLVPAFEKRFGEKRPFNGIKSCLLHYGIRANRPQIHRPNSGNFDPGHVPANLKPLGHERICSKNGYILIKVEEPNPYTGAPTRYRPKQHVVWEAANGPVPKGYILTFVDGDQLNCALDNLEVISHAEHCRRNWMQVSKAPDELKPTIKAVAKLITKTHERQRDYEQTN